jgi:5'-nucleotidase
MEPGEPREARESGPGAETAAVPRWEEAKAFHDNLTPKKKPKSVKKKKKKKKTEHRNGGGSHS